MNFDLIILNLIDPLLQSETLTIWTLILSDKHTYLWPGIATIIAFLVLNKKQGLLFVLTAIITVLLADAIADKILKPLIALSRPCHALGFARTHDNFFLSSVYCSKSFSFPSSQAVNVFTLATLWTGFFGKTGWVAFLLAIWVGWTRIYLGVHYPSDVLGGMLIGISMGVLALKLCDRIPLIHGLKNQIESSSC
jgi:membrane-associated phospholipid phosphatase